MASWPAVRPNSKRWPTSPSRRNTPSHRQSARTSPPIVRRPAAAGVTFANPANDFTAIAVRNFANLSRAGHLGHVARLGYGEAVQPVGTAQTSVNGNRVDSNYGTIDEWYVNGPGGLEQGFNDRRPQSEATGSLTVELALGGDLTGTVNAAGNGLNLTRPDGAAALGYSGLTAFDATGKSLPASLEVQTEGGRQELLIHVNNTGARGAITIDPFVEQAEPHASDGAAGDEFRRIGCGQWQHGGGRSAGATVGSNSSQGAVYVFTEPSDGWSDAAETAKLTASNGAANDFSSLGFH